jgi:hypothetical protein
MIEILILLAVFGVGFFIGEASLAWRLRDLVYKEARAKGINVSPDLIVDDEKPTVAKLFIEKANNMLYLYDYDENTFICQAKTIDELASLALKYKNINYAAVLDGDDMLMFVEGSVKTK